MDGWKEQLEEGAQRLPKMWVFENIDTRIITHSSLKSISSPYKSIHTENLEHPNISSMDNVHGIVRLYGGEPIIAIRITY